MGKLTHGVLKEYAPYLKKISKLINKTGSDENVQEELNAICKTLIEKLEKQIAKFDIGSGKAWDFSKEKNETIFAEDDTVYLTPIDEKYFDSFLSTCKSYATYPGMFTIQDLKPTYFEDLKEEHSLYMAIIRKTDNSYTGYVVLKDTRKNLWEVGMELLPEHCNHGYGYRALKMFMKRVSEITGDNKQQFMVLIEADNIPSRRMTEKLNGQLIDIYNLYFSSEEDATEYEEKHLSEINDSMIEMAQQLDVEPRKLLSHVLDYRLFAEKL